MNSAPPHTPELGNGLATSDSICGNWQTWESYQGEMRKGLVLGWDPLLETLGEYMGTDLKLECTQLPRIWLKFRF